LFTGLPGGFNNDSGIFTNVGTRGYWWSSSLATTTISYVWFRMLSNDNGNLYGGWGSKNYGFSVRCVRD
jgi:uncharacterized protein (TIGR02145 family)